MGRFQSCRGVVERALRRAFYDGVLELYEGHSNSDTVTAVTLEGTLTLTINKMETLLIRLNEVAQRAEEVSLEPDDSTHPAQSHSDVNDKEDCSRRKRKRDDDDEDNDKKVSVKKEFKTDKDTKKDWTAKKSSVSSETKKETTATQLLAESSEARKDTGCSPQRGDHVSDNVKAVKAERERTPSPIKICIKQEPKDSVSDLESGSQVSPGPSSELDTLTRISPQDTLSDGLKCEDSVMDSPFGLDLTMEVKKEPKVEESILIEDEEEDDDDVDSSFSSRHKYRSAQQASPVHSLWYRRPQNSRHQPGSHRTAGRDRSARNTQPTPLSMDTSDPHQMAMLLERNDCPLCGEVLHNRKDLASHLHSHRHSLKGSCSVCRANTLTLDALLLHFSTAHSPRLLPLPATATSDPLLSQALVPALPYTPTPMSAIASLVSMAACQAGPSSAALLGGGMGVGGVSSLMEQIISYRGLLPCPVCQLLCPSRQHLAAHLALIHADVASGGQVEGLLDDESKCESRQDSDGESESTSNFTCFDCSQSFSCQAAFSQHCMLQHNSSSAVSQGSCSVCHRAFHTWKALHAHYLSAHAITNFCDRCKMGFTSSAELKTHYDSMHGADTRNLTFICDICNKGFYSQSQCSAHKRSHISEKSFACQVCGSAFFKRGDLSKHFRTVHAPNRVFSCRFCGKRGTRMDNMRSHVKSHGKHMTRDEVLSFIEEVSPN